jgi:predicted permease
MHSLWQDLRFGVRTLLRAPGFAAVAITALALGIAANSAIFTVIDGVLLKPLPYRDPGRLVRVYAYNPVERFTQFPLSPADFRDYRNDNRSFEDVVTYLRQDQQYSGAQPERLICARVSYGFFRLFGVAPMMGREFTPEEAVRGPAADVAMVSYSLWRRLLGGDPNAIGRTIYLTDSPFRVIGVMPAGFEHVNGGYRLPHAENVEVWIPFNLLGADRISRVNHNCNTIARLKPGVSLEQAQAEMNTIARRMESANPDDKNWRIELRPLQDDLVGKAQPTLLILAGAVGFVLLIACVNVANLLLARQAARKREMAIRTAVGASRGRLVAQMLTESSVLAALGGALGLLLAYCGVRVLQAMGPEEVPRLHSISLDLRAVLVTAVISIVAGLLFGLAPALSASTSNLRRRGPGGVFVAAEVALTFVLLIGAGLLLRSFVALGRVQPGFQAHGVVTVNTTVSWSKLGGARKYLAFYREFLQKVSAIPGVTASGAATNLPWTGANDNALFAIEGRARTSDAAMNAHYLYVSPDYLHAIGVPLLAGRWLTEQDHFDAPRVALVNRTLAMRYWSNVDAAVGQRIYTMRTIPDTSDGMTIVGVVGDVKDVPTDSQAQPALFPAYLQNPQFQTYIALRSDAPVAHVIATVRDAARRMGNDLSVQEIRSMEEVIASSIATQRFALQMIGLFAGLALVLALVGIYGVMAYAASRRTREIAIRMALGAQPADTLRLLMGHGVRLIVAGILVGGVAAAALTRILRDILYQVTPTDPWTFAAVGAVLAITAAIACWAPARKTLQIDPAESLRQE